MAFSATLSRAPTSAILRHMLGSPVAQSVMCRLESGTGFTLTIFPSKISSLQVLIPILRVMTFYLLDMQWLVLQYTCFGCVACQFHDVQSIPLKEATLKASFKWDDTSH